MRCHSVLKRSSVIGLVGLLCACGENGNDSATQVTGGDAERGAGIIREVDCGVCHRIPGIKGADGVVGPPLDAWSHRSFITGRYPNKPQHLISWLLDPPAMDPETAMPDMDLTVSQARDIAAYLYSLD